MGSTSGANQRLQKELQAIKKEPPPLCTAEPLSADDLYMWKATIKGPPDSPFKGGLFHLFIEIPKEYPFKAPHVTFATKIYHPNVNDGGDICLDVLKHKWTPGMTLSSVLVSICSLLCDPNPDDPLVFEIGQQYKKDRPSYVKIATEWTQKYALPTPEATTAAKSTPAKTPK